MARNQEHQLQVSCVNWFRYQYPQYKMLLFAIPNGGQRNRIVAAKLKAEGVVSGVSDLFLSVPNHGKHGFYIEMKISGNKPTENQKKFLGLVDKFDYQTQVCYSFDEFKEAIKSYLNAQ